MRTEPLTPDEVAACPACAFGWEPTTSSADAFCRVHAPKPEAVEGTTETDEVQS